LNKHYSWFIIKTRFERYRLILNPFFSLKFYPGNFATLYQPDVNFFDFLWNKSTTIGLLQNISISKWRGRIFYRTAPYLSGGHVATHAGKLSRETLNEILSSFQRKSRDNIKPRTTDYYFESIYIYGFRIICTSDLSIYRYGNFGAIVLYLTESHVTTS